MLSLRHSHTGPEAVGAWLPFRVSEKPRSLSQDEKDEVHVSTCDLVSNAGALTPYSAHPGP